MLRVIAATGLRVPYEHAPRTYIEAKPVEVADTTYYRRRLASGELIAADADIPPAPTDITPQLKRSKA
jgi:hypothetical protein